MALTGPVRTPSLTLADALSSFEPNTGPPGGDRQRCASLHFDLLRLLEDDRRGSHATAEDAFTDHLRDYPCHVLRSGRGFDQAKRVTIATLQTMIAEYRDLSPGYFDLVITDECHRSIYGKWSGVLRHFDGIQLGLTATPCTVDADNLPDPEDGRFVRDTLRFFGLEAPTFRYTLREACATAHFMTAPIRCRTRLAVTRLADQMGSSTAMTSALVTASTVLAPRRGKA